MRVSFDGGWECEEGKGRDLLRLVSLSSMRNIGGELLLLKPEKIAWSHRERGGEDQENRTHPCMHHPSQVCHKQRPTLRCNISLTYSIATSWSRLNFSILMTSNSTWESVSWPLVLPVLLLPFPFAREDGPEEAEAMEALSESEEVSGSKSVWSQREKKRMRRRDGEREGIKPSQTRMGE